jgi:hypothetical protein
MNKLLTTLLLSVFTVGVVYAQEETPELNVALHSFPPFQYKENGEIIGPTLKIINTICDEARVKCNITMGAFNEQYEKAIKNEADIIITFLINNDVERNKLFLLSPPILKTSYSFFVNSDSKWVWTGNIRDLDGRNIGAYGPSGTSNIAKRLIDENTKATMVLEKTNLVVFEKLISSLYGEKACIIVNTDVGLAYLRKGNITGPKIAGKIEDGYFGLGFVRSSSKFYLAPRIMKAIEVSKKNGLIPYYLKNNDPPLVPAN